MSNYYRLACGLIAALVSQAGFAQSDIQQSLIERGLFWQARDDGKRAAEAWTKLLEISPDNPQALYGLATIDLKAGRLGEAQSYLQRLQQVQPKATQTAQLAQDIRLSAPQNKALLEEIRQAVVNSDYEIALQKYEQLFQNHQPVGSVGRDYYTLLGYAPNSIRPAIQNLERLQKEAPKDTGIELSLARHLARDESTRVEGIRRLAKLSEDSEIGNDAAESWRDALLWLGPPQPAAQEVFRDYLRKHPNDTEIRHLLEQSETLIAQARQQAASASRAAPVDPLRQRTNAAMKLVDAGDIAAARAEFETVLATRPNDSEALGGLGVLAMREGHWQQAHEYLSRARRGNPTWQSSLNVTNYWIDVEKAQAAYQAGDINQAKQLAVKASRLAPNQVGANLVLADIMLEQGQTERAMSAYRAILKREPGNTQALFGLSRATRLAGNQAEASQLLEKVLAERPDNPWAHYELAMVYRHEGKTTEAQKIIDQLIKTNPDDPRVLQISALMAAENQQWARARATLDRIPDDQRNAPINQLYANVNRQSQISEAVHLARSGKKAEAIQWLEQISAGAGSNDLAITNAVAKAYVDIGEPNRGLALIKPLRSERGERGVDASINYAGLLMAANQDMDASLLLRQLQASNLTASQRERVNDLADGYRIRQAEQLTAKGQVVAAYDMLEPVLKRRPNDLTVQGALARMYAADGQSAKALAIYEKLIEADPNNAQLHLGMALLAQQTGNDAKARRETEKAVELAPDNHQVLVAAAQLSRHAGRTSDAVKLLEKALEAEAANASTPRSANNAVASTNPFVKPTTTAAVVSAPDLAQELEALYEQRSAQIRGGVDIRNRTGESGTSQLTEVQAPIEVLFPLGNGQMSIRATPVTLYAGAIKVPAYSGPSHLMRYDPLRVNDQSQTGVGFALGYRYRGMEFDGGVTPVGFLQTSFVGGALFTGTLDNAGTLSYRLDISRRAVTDSVLAFAGRRYDNAGLTWGGVTATGARLTLSKDFGSAGVYGSAAWHTLRGKNVATNQRLELNAGAYFRVINEANAKLTAGVNMNATFYNKNLGGFTYGSGGYFSPQQYYALSFPVSWAQRSGDWSYRIDGAFGIQQIRQNAAPMFPNNPEMQAYAVQMAGASNLFGSGGYYPAQSKSSFSYNLKASAEYRMSPNLVFGAALAANNAEDYREWMGGLYLRYYFHPQTQSLLDIPIEPYRSPYSSTYGR